VHHYTQQLKVLEAELGVQLITRKNRSFTITPAGEYFYHQGKFLLKEAEKLKKETVRIGRKEDEHLKIGYLHCYGHQELSQTINEFNTLHPEISIDIVTGTHEDLYDLLRFGGVDLILNDQRRALSDVYVNYHLVTTKCFVEVSSRNPLSKAKKITLQDIQKDNCILIASKEQQNNEKDYYQNTFGLGSNFLFANSMEEGHLMVVGNRGYMLTEGTKKARQSKDPSVVSLPLYTGKQQITVNYYAFWQKERTNPYIEEFATILHSIFEK
jgi:DNA-binding transcriptional LysR family regulator